MKHVAYAAAAAFALLAQPAVAACDLSLGSVTAPSVTHDPFSALATQMSFVVSVSNRSDEACTASIVLAPRGGRYVLSSGGDELAFQIRFPEGHYEGVQSTPILVNVPAMASRSVTFDAEIQRSLAVPGIFTGEVELRLSNDMDIVDQATVSLRAAVPAKAQMTISGTRSASRERTGPNTAMMDLGVLENGDQGTVFVNVFANSSVRVTLQSENSGSLKLVDNPRLPSIPYRVDFAGDAVSLSAPVQLTKTPPLTAQGASYPLTITVPSVDGRYSGVYRDIVTVTIDTN